MSVILIEEKTFIKLARTIWYDSKLKGALIFETAQMALDYVIKYKGTSNEVIIYQLL